MGGKTRRRTRNGAKEIGNGERSGYNNEAKLRFNPFKGTPTDWVSFENLFVTQAHRKPSFKPAEEKFGYLLEMVTPAVRGKIGNRGNLKPGEIGYKNSVGKAEDRVRQKQHGGLALTCKSIKGIHFLRIH